MGNGPIDRSKKTPVSPTSSLCNWTAHFQYPSCHLAWCPLPPLCGKIILSPIVPGGLFWSSLSPTETSFKKEGVNHLANGDHASHMQLELSPSLCKSELTPVLPRPSSGLTFSSPVFAFLSKCWLMPFKRDGLCSRITSVLLHGNC